jgi:uncharacterized protein (DUF1778 family)
METMDRQKAIEAAVEEAMKLIASGEFDQFDPRQALSALVALRVPDATVSEMQNAFEECAEEQPLSLRVCFFCARGAIGH